MHTSKVGKDWMAFIHVFAHPRDERHMLLEYIVNVELVL